MGMNAASSSASDSDVMIEMNMTPMIDVMLVLIVMFIITIPIQNHVVNMNLPVGPPPNIVEPPKVVTIDVDFDGTILWDGAILAGGRNELDGKLLAVAQTKPEQPEVHLKPNALADYKYVAAVMSSAQKLGVTKIGLVGNEQFMQ